MPYSLSSARDLARHAVSQSPVRASVPAATSPLQAKVDRSPRQLQQVKRTAACKQVVMHQNGLTRLVPQREVAVPRKSSQGVVQAKFKLTADGKTETLTSAEVTAWYLGTAKKSLSEEQAIVLQLLAEGAEEIDLSSFGPDNDLGDYLKERERDFRPFIKYFDEKQAKMRIRRIPGKLSVERIGALEDWKVGSPKDVVHGIPADLDANLFTELTHVTYHASHLDYKKIDPSYGSNPGEFGKGFYLTTGHETQPQTEVSKKWGDAKKGYPKEVVRFRISNGQLSKSVGKDDNKLNFLIHMLQHSSGYPQGMTEDAAIGMMGEINKLGNVLLFPDDKSKKVAVEENQSLTWEEYTAYNSGPSNHFIVVGPQRPPELNNIRQIAFRGHDGETLINMVKRSSQHLG